MFVGGQTSARTRYLIFTVFTLALLVVTGTQVAQAQKYKVLFQFKPGADGIAPLAGLVLDSSGNLYGTTQVDGRYAYGTVFKLSATGKETVLHSFSGIGGDGQFPSGGLYRDQAGKLYGTTNGGGTYGGPCGSGGCGIVFRIDTAGRERVLHQFVGNPDGNFPYGGVIRDSSGNLYGTTLEGGANSVGSVFEIDTSGAERVLHSFNFQNSDGYLPYGGVVRDSAGNLYGATSGGGTIGGGTVFKVDTNDVETVLYSFGQQTTDGVFPMSSLIRDSAGTLYGTTNFGGAFNSGTVFTVDSTGKETVLYSFGATSTDGAFPIFEGVVQDAKGNLYGATNSGGAHSFGTVYKLDTTGKETILHNFTGTDGKIPYGNLILDGKGNLYGTTNEGGAFGGGVIFKITP